MFGTVSSVAARAFSWVEELLNDTGDDIVEGSVVVVLADGTIALADTLNDPRPTGVVKDTIDDGDTGQVVFGGPVDLVLVTASVTAGQFGQTSTTPGEAQVTASAGASFCMFTSSGTSPRAILWGGRGGGGLVADLLIELLSTNETDTALFLHPDGTGGVEWTGTGGGSDPVFDHGNMGATETVDVGDGTWHRGTLNADCTVTVQGFTVDEGLVLVFEVEQDGTGGWGITWDPDVTFIGDDQPDLTASTVTVFLLFSSAGDSTIYGARVGADSLTSPLTTKGDLWGYDTSDARVPVGANGYLLAADSTDAQGVVWRDPQATGHYELLMDGSSPPAPLEDGSGTDWLYVWVP